MTVLTPLKAIRAKCLDCMCGNSAEVRRCPCEDCSLFPYRFGKNPNIQKRELTEEQKQEARERMKRNFAKISEEGVERKIF